MLEFVEEVVLVLVDTEEAEVATVDVGEFVAGDMSDGGEDESDELFVSVACVSNGDLIVIGVMIGVVVAVGVVFNDSASRRFFASIIERSTRSQPIVTRP